MQEAVKQEEEAAERAQEEKAKRTDKKGNQRGERRGDETSHGEAPTRPVAALDHRWNEGRYRKITLVSFGRRLHDCGWLPHASGYLLNAEFPDRLFEDTCPCTGMSVVALERLIHMRGFDDLLGTFCRKLRQHPLEDEVAFNVRCKWGKHRSVACRYALELGVKAAGWRHIDAYDYEREDKRWQRTLAGIVLNNTCFNTRVSKLVLKKICVIKTHAINKLAA